jgi:hypothetical protein
MSGMEEDTLVVIEESKQGQTSIEPLAYFCLPLETYHIHISSIMGYDSA